MNSCACGCERLLNSIDSRGRHRRYINGHQTKTLVWKRRRPYPAECTTIGRKASAETRIKLSIAHIGQAPGNKGKKQISPAWNKGLRGQYGHSLETRKMISAALKGAKSHLWRGGISSPRNIYTLTTEWKILRKIAYRRDGWRCRVCGNAPGVRLQCHHIIPVSRGGEVYALENLASVCTTCHKRQELRYGKLSYFWADVVIHWSARHKN